MAGASLTDILASLQTGVQAINKVAIALGAGSVNPVSFYGFNGISSAPTTVVQVSSGSVFPTEISFHNPSLLDILVYPSEDGNGLPLTPISTARGGAFLVYSNGGTVVIDGGSTVAWAAISTGTTGSLTVITNA